MGSSKYLQKWLSRPIGVFDSGVGGLTVLKELIRILPGEDFIYFGDTARVPYGGRSPETVIRYSEEDSQFLISQGIKLLVVACNTSSSIALNQLRKKFPLPVIGVVEPGARAAVKACRRGRIGVIGTEATVRSGAYQKIIRTIEPGVKVISIACPLFVPLVEEGWVKDEVARLTIERYLNGFRAGRSNEFKIDVLLLGCTHYPLLKSSIQGVVGNRVKLIDSAVETAREVKGLLEKTNLIRKRSAAGRVRFYSSDDPKKFGRLGRRFLGRAVTQVRQVQV